MPTSLNLDAKAWFACRGACSSGYYRRRPSRAVCRGLLPPTNRFESIAERKIRRRQLTEDGNVEITGCDLMDQRKVSYTEHDLTAIVTRSGEMS
jgi:hypothetical protein